MPQWRIDRGLLLAIPGPAPTRDYMSENAESADIMGIVPWFLGCGTQRGKFMSP